MSISFFIFPLIPKRIHSTLDTYILFKLLTHYLVSFITYLLGLIRHCMIELFHG